MAGADHVRARVRVRGRVQGVFFRHSTAEHARAAGLTGWVRNMPDGSVEATFQGLPPQVEAVIDWCRSGPPAARVADVAIEWEAPVPSEDDFRVSG